MRIRRAPSTSASVFATSVLPTPASPSSSSGLPSCSATCSTVARPRSARYARSPRAIVRSSIEAGWATLMRRSIGRCGLWIPRLSHAEAPQGSGKGSVSAGGGRVVVGYPQAHVQTPPSHQKTPPRRYRRGRSRPAVDGARRLFDDRREGGLQGRDRRVLPTGVLLDRPQDPRPGREHVLAERGPQP